MKDRRTIFRLLGLSLISIGLAWALGRYYYVGATHDDATYLIGAQSLAQGRYVNLAAPNEPPLTTYPPGWPALLAPLAAVSQEPWTLLRWLNVILVLVSALLVLRLPASTRPELAAALFLLHPIVLAYATTLMADVLFVGLLLISFVALSRYLERGHRRFLVTLMGATAYGCLTRTTGFLLVPAIVLGLCIARRRKAAALVATVGFVAAALFPLRNGLLHENPVGSYALVWQDSVARFTGVLDTIRQIWGSAQSSITEDVLLVPQDHVLLIMLGVILTLAMVALLVSGLRISRTPSPERRGSAAAAALYIVLLLVVHSLYKGREPRYALPLIPLFIALGSEGWRRFTERWPPPKRRAAASAAVLSLFVLYARAYAHLYQQAAANWQNGSGRPAEETFHWLKSSLPAKSSILYAKPSELYLYCGLTSVPPIRAADAMQFRLAVLSRGASHVLVKPVPLDPSGNPSPDDVWRANQFWSATWPAAFQRIYENPAEQTAVYAVRPDPRFALTYRLYRQAQQALQQQQIDKTFQLYERILKLDPGSIPILVRYAGLSLQTHRHLTHARNFLRTSPGSASHPALGPLLKDLDQARPVKSSR